MTLNPMNGFENDDRLTILEDELLRFRKKTRRMTMLLLVMMALILTSNYEGIRKAWAGIGGNFLLGMSSSNAYPYNTPNSAATNATELQSSNSSNTLKVMQTSGAGHAVHAVNNGTDNVGYRANAIHAWAATNAGHAVYGESSNSSKSAIFGVGLNAPGGEFGVRNSSSGRGAIRLVPQPLAAGCFPGDLAVAVDSGDLYFCKIGGWGTDWEKVVLQ